MIKRLALLEALNKTKSGLAQGKEKIDQSMSFVFSKGYVITYNDEIAISHPVDGIGFSCVVPGPELHALLNKVKDEDLDVKLVGEELVITGKKFKASLRTQVDIRLPIEDFDPGKQKWSKLPEDFIEALKFCLFTAGKDTAKPILSCVHILGSTMETCDNARFTIYAMKNKVPTEFLLPERSARELQKYVMDKISVADNWVHFMDTASDCMFSCRTYSGKYPELRPIMQMKGKTHELKFSPMMASILDRAAVAMPPDDPGVRVVIKDGTLTVKGDDKKVLKYEESTRVKADMDITFGINPEFLKQILEHTDTAVIDEEGTKLIFAGDHFEHLLTSMVD